jgi:hypothetical protein
MKDKTIVNLINRVLEQNADWFQSASTKELPIIGLEMDLQTPQIKFSSTTREQFVKNAGDAVPAEMLEHVAKDEHNSVLVVFIENGQPNAAMLVPILKFQVLDLKPIGSA